MHLPLQAPERPEVVSHNVSEYRSPSALLVIFGAGASYDSNPSLPSEREANGGRPPLAKNLFDERPEFLTAIKRFSRCAPIVRPLRRVILAGENIEGELTRLEREASTYPERKCQLLAVQYFLREIVDYTVARWHDQMAGVSNYATISDRLMRWVSGSRKEFSYVTCNYDVLLEEALKNFGFAISNVNSYIAGQHSGIPNLYKLHGSTNWLREMDTPLGLDLATVGPDTAATGAVENVGLLRPTDRYVLGTLDDQGTTPIAFSCARVPAIAIPIDVKQEFVCSTSHVGLLRESLKRTTANLIIGWRGSDRELVDLLATVPESSHRVFLVNGTEEENGLAQMRITEYGARNLRFGTHFNAGFSEFLAEDGMEEVLRVA